jgi:hypothetical protein
MTKSRGKLVHIGGRSAMSCGLLALDKFSSAPYTSRKYVVMLIMLLWSVSYGNNLKLLKF